MFKVKISTTSSMKIIRQTPGCNGQWGEYQFFINSDIEECDYWIVYEEIGKSETTICPGENVILITGEPPSYKTYHEKFLKQFSKIITSHTNIHQRGIFNTQQALPWMIGEKYNKETNQWEDSYTKDYDMLSKMKEVKKSKLISVITSTKIFTKGHRDRIQFVERLKKHFGDTLDVFGNGINTIEDKWDAIAHYKYHIAIENSSYDHYFTEKITDTFLSLSYPIYFGCPNLEAYFPKKSFSRINIYDFDQSIKTIENIISENVYERDFSHLEQGRDLALNKYNLFPTIVGFLQRNCKENVPKEKIAIDTEKNLKRNIIKRTLYKIIKK